MPGERTRPHRARAGRRIAAWLLPPALALSIAACGSSSQGGNGIDPASLTPASAQVYAGALVRPGEPLRGSARAVAMSLTHQADPYVRLLALLQTPGSPKLEYARDVRPWLGERAGVFLNVAGASTSPASVSTGVGDLLTLLQRTFAGESAASSQFPFSSAGVDGAVLLDASDTSRARSFLAAQASRAGAHASSYRGTSYEVTNTGVALGLVKQIVVLGSESALHAVIDSSLGAPALASSSAYSKLAAAAPAHALAHLYVNPPQAPSGAPSSARAGASEANALALLAQLDGGRPLDISLVPSQMSVAIDLDTPAGGAQGTGGLLSASAAGATALGELPAESWLGIGLGGGGSSVGAGVRGLRSVLSLLSSSSGPSNGVVSVKGLLAGFLAPLEVLGAETPSARRDFQSWMSSAALFASGTSLLDVKGGVAILSSNPALSRAAVGKLAAALRRAGLQVGAASVPGTDAAAAVRLTALPLPLDIADGRDAAGHTKFVIGLGEGSVTSALTATSTLAGGPAVSAGTAALGEGIQPSMTVEFPTLLGVLEAAGLTEDPTIAPFVGYARSLTTLAGGGSHPAAGIERLRITVGLRGPSAEG